MDLLRHIFPIEELKSDVIRQMADYWFEKRGSNLYPKIGDINLDDLPEVKPHASIIEINYPPFRMLYRFMGEEIIYFYGRDITNQWVDDLLTGEMLEDFTISFRMATTNDEPLLARSRWYGMHAVSEKTFEWGMFPVSENGIAVTSIIFIEDYRHLNKDELPPFLDA
jgi:hypothetical protein